MTVVFFQNARWLRIGEQLLPWPPTTRRWIKMAWPGETRVKWLPSLVEVQLREFPDGYSPRSERLSDTGDVCTIGAAVFRSWGDHDEPASIPLNREQRDKALRRRRPRS